jgi:UDP-N-acetylmuramoyl-tripeptide--D-alanyl-D-alanine ligase
MIPLRAEEVAALAGGRLVAADLATLVTGPVVVDSRLSAGGSLFVCLPGEHTDGHAHVVDAVCRGAVLVLASQPVEAPAVMVHDTQQALGFLAGGVMRRTPALRVTGVTGSSGKTSTKDLIAAVLALDGNTVAAVGSFNNEVGLPLSVLEVDAATKHLVLEYSARGLGHIAYLTGIAQPDTAVVLNVGTAHLGEFGDRETIARAKAELVEALPHDGVAVLNIDDPLVAEMAGRTDARILTVGAAPTAAVRITDLVLDDQARPRFRLVTEDGEARVALQLHGAHHAGNAAAAAAAGLAAGMPLGDIVNVLADAVALSPHRMAVGPGRNGVLVVDDAYNANPESMRAALAALIELAGRRGGQSWAVLGEMRELGDDTPTLHAAVGRGAAELGVDHLVVVGDVAAAIGEGARATPGFRGRVVSVGTALEAAGVVGAEPAPDDVVLVKASNAVQLWTVAEALTADTAGTAG